MSDARNTLAGRGQEFLQLFHRGAEVTRELLQENERLRQELAERSAALERENNTLANLYVASYQLHSTLALDEVLRVVTEIAINLVGAETFALFLVDERDGALAVRTAEGWPRERFPRLALGSGTIGSSVASGALYVGEERRSDDPARPIVCIPLRAQEQVVGAIAIYGLQDQKPSLGDLDLELFSMLARHAATALLAAKLYSQSERKLHTIQGFIELLAS